MSKYLQVTNNAFKLIILIYFITLHHRASTKGCANYCGPVLSKYVGFSEEGKPKIRKAGFSSVQCTVFILAFCQLMIRIFSEGLLETIIYDKICLFPLSLASSFWMLILMVNFNRVTVTSAPPPLNYALK